jgi:hypothetical protein
MTNASCPGNIAEEPPANIEEYDKSIMGSAGS